MACSNSVWCDYFPITECVGYVLTFVLLLVYPIILTGYLGNKYSIMGGDTFAEKAARDEATVLIT